MLRTYMGLLACHVAMYEEGLFKGDVPEHTRDSGDRKVTCEGDSTTAGHQPLRTGQFSGSRRPRTA